MGSVASFTTANTSSTSGVTISTPSGVVDGGYLQLGVKQLRNSAFNTIGAATCSGYSQVNNVAAYGSQGGNVTLTVLDKLTSGEGSSYSIVFDSLHNLGGGAATLLWVPSGLGTDAAAQNASGVGTAGTITVPSMTTVTNGDLIIGWAALNITGTPSGFSSVNSHDSLACYSKTQTTAGATGTMVQAASDTAHTSPLVAIQAAVKFPALEVDLTIASDGTSTTSVTVTTVQEADLTVSSAGLASPSVAFITTPRLSSSSSGTASSAGSLISPERLLVASGGVAAPSSSLFAPSLMGLLSVSGLASPTAALFAYSLLGSLTVSGVAVTTLALASPYLFTVSASGLASVSGQAASRVLLLVNSGGTSTAIAVLRSDMPIMAAGSSSASSVLIAPVVLPVGAGGVGALSGALVSPTRLTATAGGTGTPTTTLFARSLLGALSASGAAVPSGALSAAAPLLVAGSGAASDSLLISTSYFTILSAGNGSPVTVVSAPGLFLLEADGAGTIHMVFYGGISGINVSKRFNAGYVRDDGFLGGYVVRRRGV